MEITTVGIDLAKSIFQVHAVDAVGHVVVRKALRRAQVVPFFAKLPRCSVDFSGTNRMLGRVTAPQMAAASFASVLPRLTYGFT